MQQFDFPIYGTLKPLFPRFKVDDFSVMSKTKPNFFTFFLTHCHEDHLKGLSHSFKGQNYSTPNTDWRHGKIYCSETSANLLLHRFPHLKPFVNPLKLHKVYKINNA